MKIKTVVIALVVVAIVSAAAYYLGAVIRARTGKPTVQSLSGGYEAVFLTNGQVYFGKVAKRGKDEIVIKDIYYLRVEQQLQPAPENDSSNKQSQPQLGLVKLGDEIHGPADEMRLNMDHVLFTESLKDSGQVVQAIRRHKESVVQKEKSPN